MGSFVETNNKSELLHYLENTHTVDSESRKNLRDMLSQLTKVNKNHSHDWKIIEDQSLVRLILESFGDEDKRKILNSAVDTPLSFSDILKTCEIPKTSGHRKINSLIKTGMLKTKETEIGNFRKRIYRSVFEDVIININRGRPTIIVKFT